MGLCYEVFAKVIDEKPLYGEDPKDFVIRMALENARVVSRHFPDAWVVSGDAEVCFDQKILGKPVDDEAAVRMIMDISGREHIVRTDFCVVHSVRNIEVVRSVATTVQFAHFSESTARAYVATGESLD